MNDDQNDVFDVDRVRSLVELMIEHGLVEEVRPMREVIEQLVADAEAELEQVVGRLT